MRRTMYQILEPEQCGETSEKQLSKRNESKHDAEISFAISGSFYGFRFHLRSRFFDSGCGTRRTGPPSTSRRACRRMPAAREGCGSKPSRGASRTRAVDDQISG